MIFDAIILGDNKMQLAIELPDDTASEVLQHSNVQEFIKRAIERELSNVNTFKELRNDPSKKNPHTIG